MKKQILLIIAVFCCLWSSAQNYPIGTRIDTFIDATRSNRQVIFNLYYPAVTAGAKTAIANDSFPVVVFGHGFVIPSTDYADYADTLAKRGFIVACPSTESSTSASHPNFAQDLILVHNKLISEGKTNPASKYYQKVIAKGAIGGHSMGGGSTVLSCSYSNPATCYFTFGAANTTPSSISAAKLMTKPYLDIAGLKDCVAPPATHQIPMYDSSASPCKYYIGLANATHCQFANGSASLCYAAEGFVSGCASSPYLSKTQQTNAVLNYLLPYLYYYLKGSCPAWTQFQNTYTADATSTKKSSCNNIIPSNPSISGTTSFCAGGNTTLTANPAGFSYTWSNGISTQTNNVTAANTYSVSVSNGTCTIVAPTVSVTVNNPPTLPTAITSLDSVCANITGVSFATTSTGATSYSWTLPSGWNITSATNIATITATAGTSGGTVSVSAINSCGTTSAQTKTIVIKPSLIAPTSISGADSVCANTASLIYSIPAVANATGYTWTVPSGWNITTGNNSNQITVTSSSTAGAITVSALGACGNTAPVSKNVAIKSSIGNPTAIISIDSVCANASGVVLSTSVVSGANGYKWALPSGWNITSTPTNANSITVTAGTTGGNVSVTANSTCGNSSSVSKSIKTNTTPVQPSAINGLAAVCTNGSGISYDVALISGATSYNWTLPSGWNISSGANTNVISVNAGSAGGQISVTATNVCGTSSSQTKTISVSPGLSAPTTITSPDTVCANATGITFTASTIANAIGYAWTLPSGWNITAGANTLTITTTASATAGNVSVAAIGSCGNGPTFSKNIFIKTTPTLSGTINGADTVCMNQGTATFSTSNGFAPYNWNIPTAWNLVSGQNTNSISISNIKTSGTVSVSAANGCGSGNILSKNVFVSDTPTATITRTGNSLSASPTGASYQWYFNGGIIQGANSQTYTPTAEGKYIVIISDAFGCSGIASDFLYAPNGIETLTGIQTFVNVYPNPVADKLTIRTSFNSFDAKIFDAVGKEIKSIHASAGSLEWNVADLSAGMYIVKVQHKGNLKSIAFAKVQ